MKHLQFLGLLSVLGRVPRDTFIKSCCSLLTTGDSFLNVTDSSEQPPHFSVAMVNGATKQLSTTCCREDIHSFPNTLDVQIVGTRADNNN